MNILLLTLWILTGIIHLGIPLAYFASMRRASARDGNYRLNLKTYGDPTVSILIPTYNEASVIEKKLVNISEISYPKEKLQIVLTDGGSTDGTPELARRILERTGLRGEVLEEGERKGKAAGLNLGLKLASEELVCISDAECQWDKEALRNAVRYLSDPSVGSVSGIHEILNPHETLSTQLEDSYRSVYRVLRIGESKIHSTPVAEGELQVFRRNELAGFDPKVGGDDSDAALNVISKGLRAISAEDVVFYEPTPRNWRSRFRQKIRRGQHILQAFLKHKRLLFSGRSAFSTLIFPMEFFLYIINPILFVPFLALTILVLATISLIAYVAAAGLVVSLIIPGLRRTVGTYLSNNLIMLAAILQEVSGNRQLLWTKIEENRRDLSDGQSQSQSKPDGMGL